MGQYPEPGPDGPPLRNQIYDAILAALIVIVGIHLALAVLRWLVLA